MKFLCDRCKTRYSIADERVRGKVLKIRCKSCSHVITVREGMTDDDGEAPAAVAAPASTAAPAAAVTRGGTFAGLAPAGRTATAAGNNGSALADAFAQVMQPQRADSDPPPPALEEEWYVSLDGNQEGPFSLAEAQAWIAGKKHDDDLYCWSEGFDDWLPVDKVSHFRSLRKALPAARVKPPVPTRAGAAPARAAASAPATPVSPADSGSQPLFAATLASLEAEVEVDAGRGKASTPSPSKPGTGKTNGKAPAGGVPGKPGKPGGAAASAAITSLSGADAKGRAASSRFDLEGEGSRPDRELPELEPDDDDEKDEDLEIGEVSRVVRLPDLMAAHQRQVSARNATGRTGQTQAIRTPAPAIARGTGGAASLTAAAGAPDGAAIALDGSALPPLSDAALADLQPAVVAAPTHKHHALLLIAAAIAVLVIGGVIAVVVATQVDDEGAVATGDTSRFDSLGRRIDDPRRIAKAQAQAQAAAKASGKTGTTIRKPFGTNSGVGGPVGAGATGKTEVVIGPDGKPLEPLTVDEMLAVSSKMSSGTRRCYERALKEDPFLKVSKITVSIVVEDSGVVSSVTLDAFTTQTLGKCLTAAIRRWPFRRSPKRESFVFPLVFEQR